MLLCHSEQKMQMKLLVQCLVNNAKNMFKYYCYYNNIMPDRLFFFFMEFMTFIL